MAAYTIEDVELIRRKSGVSYQEAVALLDYHNGNVARALVDLERNGRIHPESAAASAPETASAKSGGKGGLMDLINRLFRARIKINRGETRILNISSLFALLTLLISPHLVIIAAIVCVVLGYKFSFVSNDQDFASENLERTVRHAADNVKASVSSFSFNSDRKQQSAPATEEAPASEADRSYYNSRNASASYRASAPTLNVPVQVESQDGSVTMEQGSDGYTSATIE